MGSVTTERQLEGLTASLERKDLLFLDSIRTGKNGQTRTAREEGGILISKADGLDLRGHVSSMEISKAPDQPNLCISFTGNLSYV